jgi:RNA polymerase sigma factor (sigma-70 family)
MGGGDGGELPPPEKSGLPSGCLEKTADLIARARHGDPRARNLLASRYQDVLRRLAHGRLPRSARSLADTDDIVQETQARALVHLDSFEPRGEGAYLAYLRRILFNLIKDGWRSERRAPVREELGDDLPGANLSPLDEAIGRDRLEAYQEALATLKDEQQQQAVILRLEMGLTYEQIAAALDAPSGNAVRMLISRALVKVAEAMRAHRESGMKNDERNTE